MAAIVILLGVAAMALPALLASLGRRLKPREWAYVTAAAVVGGFGLLEIGLVFSAIPTLLRFVGVDALAEACERLLAPVAPGGAAIGWVTAVLAAAIPAAGVRAVRNALDVKRRLRRELWLGERHDVGGTPVTVLPAGTAFAAALDGPEPAIVVSREMVDALTPAELDAVVRHEAAHLAGHHPALLLVSTLLEGTVATVLRPLHGSARTLRFALERWADEDAAAGSSHDRRALRSALLSVACSHAALPVPAFSDAETVVARIDALSSLPASTSRATRFAVYAPSLAVGFGAFGALTTWTGHARMLFTMAGSCPL